MKLNLVTLAVAIVMFVFLAMYAAKLPWTAWRVVGMAIAVPAFLLFAAARIELGRAFSVRAKATKLVTMGIYSRIRNPIYLFLWRGDDSRNHHLDSPGMAAPVICGCDSTEGGAQPQRGASANGEVWH